MMKNLVLLVVFLLKGLVKAELENIVPYHSYHEEVGIPLAQELYEIEVKMHQKDMIGKHKIDSRIVYGTNSSLLDRPYMGGLLITLFNNKRSICGSSLLSTRRTLTAGQCIFDGTHSAKSVEIIHNSVTIHYGGVRTVSKTFVVYPYFNHSTLMYDLAMIYHTDIPLSAGIQPIALLRGYEQYTLENVPAVTVGYGRISSFYCGDIIWGQTRREVIITIIGNKLCAEQWPGLTYDIICTRGVREAVGICHGDTGGPLAIVINGVQTLVGTASFPMIYCDHPPFYSAYTRITQYMLWIDQHLK